MSYYLAFNGSTLFRGNANNIGYAYTGVPSPMPTLNTANYAVFRFGTNTISFPRINYQIGAFGADSSFLRFKKGGFDSGVINMASKGNVTALLQNIGLRFNITGATKVFEPAVEEAAEKKNKKGVEEIINLILNYGAKAVDIAKGLGIVKNNANSFTGAAEVNDGWGDLSGTGLDGNGIPQQKQLDTGSTILGIKTEHVLIGVGGSMLLYAVLKK